MRERYRNREGSMSERRLKHFGWGREGEGLTAEEEAFALDRYRRLFAVDRFDERSPPALSEIALRPPRIAPPPALAPHCSERTLRSGRPHLRQVFLGLRSRARRSIRQRARCRRLPAQRSRGRRGRRLGGRRSGGADPVRRRQQRRRRRRAGDRGHRVPRGDLARSAASGPRRRSRPHLARRAHRGRRLWPRARGAAQAA